MQRLNDNFLQIIDDKINLREKIILEVGCGIGNKSVALANKCSKLYAIDPNVEAIATANKDYSAANLTYSAGSAEQLDFNDAMFDVVIFSLSLHHVPVDSMDTAIHEASRVTNKGGGVVFLEPAFNGSFFDTELHFGASDGDERKEKAAAHFEILRSHYLKDETEFYDEITFAFESVEEFIKIMEPKYNLDQVKNFLEEHRYTLKAQRRINVFSFV